MLMSSLLLLVFQVFAEEISCEGEGCRLSMLQQQVVATLESEEAVNMFQAALEEGDETDKDTWGGSSSTYGHYGSSYGNYGNPYGNYNPYGTYNSYGNPPYGQPGYGGGNGYGYSNPYAVPGYGPTGCMTKIASSSCMVFDCAKSRGPTRCNTQDYYCYCQPGYCSDGHGCMPAR
mmetsp:Transcript_89995/g.110174  ORF Transcript_89995/g.110174 Transcript_89995/m.110174 type:complete len:175 (+) Transcript_89995:58-582(+)